MVVLGVEERNAGRVSQDDVAGGVEELLRRHRALVVVDAVDRAGRDLAAAADLEVPRAELMCVVENRSHSFWWSFWIPRCDGHLLDDVGVQRHGRRRFGSERRGQNAPGGHGTGA